MRDQYFLFLVDEMDFAYEATDTETAEALLKSEEVFYHCHFDPLKAFYLSSLSVKGSYL